tara:strand:- start:2031 stop:2333 length:303 start_codon:yes stop_codon:yes gene_type:complete
MDTIKLNNEQAVFMLMSYFKAGGRLHHFNGAQWYIELAYDYVAILDTGARENITLDFFTDERAINYLKSGSNCHEPNAFENAIKSYTDLLDRHAGRPVYS